MDISDALTFCNLYSAGHRRAAHPVLLTENRPEIPVSLRKKPAAGMVPRVPAVPAFRQSQRPGNPSPSAESQHRPCRRGIAGARISRQKYLRGYGHLPAGVV